MARSSPPKYDAEVGIPLPKSLYNDEPEWKGAILPEPPPRVSKPKLRITPAAFASLAAVILLIVVCRYSKALAVQQSSSRRRLSESEDSSGSGLWNLCDDTAGRSDFASFAGPPEALAEEGPSEPTAKLRKVEVDELGRASGLSESFMGHSPSEPHASYLPSSGSGKHKQPVLAASSGIFSVESGHAAPRLENQQLHASTSVPYLAPLSMPGRSADELAAADALISLQTQAPEIATTEHNGRSDASIRKDNESAVAVALPEAGLPVGQGTAVTPTGSRLVSSVVTEPSPSTSGGAVLYEQAAKSLLQPSSSLEHPVQPHGGVDEELFRRFCRLPKVQQPGAHKWRFSFERIVDRRDADFFSWNFYEILTDLLSQDSLSPDQMDLLGHYAEVLLREVLDYDTTPVLDKNTTKAVVRLGRRFQRLDVLVSAFQVLGVPLDDWWQSVTAAIPLDILLPARPRTPTGAFNKQLLRALTSAIATLKQGVRPSSEVLIDLKTKLFCLPLSPKHLKSSRWNIWRDSNRGGCGGD